MKHLACAEGADVAAKIHECPIDHRYPMINLGACFVKEGFEIKMFINRIEANEDLPGIPGVVFCGG